MQASIVILNYNGRHLLAEFLPSVIQYSLPYNIVVVDNASHDDSVTFLQQHYPAIRCIQHKRNEGFARGYNLALQQIEATYYILLNNDVQVTPYWVSSLLNLLEKDSTIAACQPKICSWRAKSAFDYAGAAGGFIDILGYPFCRGRLFNTLEEDCGQYNDSCEIFWASGACMAVRAEAFWKVGGFDERLFAHYEEIDLCWRLQRQGYTIHYQGDAVVYHVGGATLPYDSPAVTYLKFRNRALVLYKNLSVSIIHWKHVARILLDLVAALQACLQGKFRKAYAILRAQIDFFKYKRYYKPAFIALEPNQMYQRLLPWDYFIRNKKTFNSLSSKYFSGSISNLPSN